VTTDRTRPRLPSRVSCASGSRSGRRGVAAHRPCDHRTFSQRLLPQATPSRYFKLTHYPREAVTIRSAPTTAARDGRRAPGGDDRPVTGWSWRLQAVLGAELLGLGAASGGLLGEPGRGRLGVKPVVAAAGALVGGAWSWCRVCGPRWPPQVPQNGPGRLLPACGGGRRVRARSRWRRACSSRWRCRLAHSRWRRCCSWRACGRGRRPACKQGKDGMVAELGVCGAPGRTRTCNLLFRRSERPVRPGLTSAVLAGQVGWRVWPVTSGSVWLRPVDCPRE
jgi:hypothetical protein